MSEQRMAAEAGPGQERALLVGVELNDAPDTWPPGSCPSRYGAGASGPWASAAGRRGNP